MLQILIFFISVGTRVIRTMCRRRADIVLENLALRQQVTALKKERPRPSLDDMDRANLRAVTRRPSSIANVIALPRVGGFHHRYEWRDAA